MKANLNDGRVVTNLQVPQDYVDSNNDNDAGADVEVDITSDFDVEYSNSQKILDPSRPRDPSDCPDHPRGGVSARARVRQLKMCFLQSLRPPLTLPLPKLSR